MIQVEAHKAIIELVKSDDFKSCISKVNPDHLRDDLVSEISLILLETDPHKIVLLKINKQLTFYAARIIMNLAFSNTSPFYKKYRKHLVHFTENTIQLNFSDDQKVMNISDESDDDILLKLKVEEVMLEVERDDRAYEILDFYETEMLKLYIKYGTFREMEKITHIPYVSCFHTVKKAINKLKKKVNY